MTENDDDISSDVYARVAEETQEFIANMISKVIEKHPAISEDDRFSVLIMPTMAALSSMLASYFAHIGYQKGDMLEMMCDFFDDALENCNICEDCGEIHCSDNDEDNNSEAPIDKKNIN